MAGKYNVSGGSAGYTPKELEGNFRDIDARLAALEKAMVAVVQVVSSAISMGDAKLIADALGATPPRAEIVVEDDPSSRDHYRIRRGGEVWSVSFNRWDNDVWTSFTDREMAEAVAEVLRKREGQR